MLFHESGKIEAAAGLVATRLGGGAPVAAVLGSGFSQVAGLLDRPTRIPYDQVPGLAGCTAPGHAGEVIAGTVEGARCLLFSGRLHLYEGHEAARVVVPIALARALGARTIVLTCAAGATTQQRAPGELVLVEDHLNLTGENPLLAIPPAARRPAFLGMGDAYDPGALHLAERLAEVLPGSACRGVLAGLSGPSFETPAEYRALALMGADLVSMSCVLETIAARYLGLRVLCLAIVANGPATSGEPGANETGVLQMVAGAVETRLDYFRQLLAALSRE